MKKVLVLCLSVLFSSPLFASGIGANASSALCDNSTLETYGGTSNLEVDWQPNTINISWYEGNTKLSVQDAAKTCSYGGPLTLPSTKPTKKGYTFEGWTLRMPGTYTELEYIESSGSQWIDTGITASNRAVFSMDATAHNDEMVVFIISNIDSQGYTKGFGEYYDDIAGQNNLLATGRHYYDLTYSDSGISFTYDNGDQIYTITTYSISSVKKIVLFGGQYVARRISAKLYSLKLYNNNVLVRDYIPARRNSDNVVGLWDTVTQTFFTNAGTGNFIAGPAVE